MLIKGDEEIQMRLKTAPMRKHEIKEIRGRAGLSAQ